MLTPDQRVLPENVAVFRKRQFEAAKTAIGEQEFRGLGTENDVHDLFTYQGELSGDNINFIRKLTVIKQATITNKTPIAVLDVGCGAGIALNNIKQFFESAGAQGSYEGVNANGQKAKYVDAAITQGDVQELRTVTKSQQYDLITSVATAEKLADPLAMLADIYALLKPGGSAFISRFPIRRIASSDLNAFLKILHDTYGVTVYKRHGVVDANFMIEKRPDAPSEMNLPVDYYTFSQYQVASIHYRLQQQP